MSSPENPEARSGDRPEARSGDRIAKLLARAGVASRREVERMIAEGRVKLGDEVITTANTVLANLRGVSVDGVPIKAAEPARLFAFHKPSGLITAERDPAGRPTIYTALRNALPSGTPRMMPVGRLDFNTEGLLLLTNDGELKRAMELPSSGVPRTYRARTFGAVTQAQLEDLIEGIEIDGMRYGKIDANMERSTGRNQWIEVTLTEGKNREVRRVLEHLGLEVSRLLRLSYGPFQLLDLPRGSAVEIRQVDVERFRKSLNSPGTLDSFVPRTVGAPAHATDPRAPASTRPAREPERRMSEERPRRAAPKKPLARKPDPERLSLATPRRGSGKPSFDAPRADRTGADRPGTDRSGTDRSSTGRARSDRPRSEATRAEAPGSAKPYAGKPHANRSDSARPDRAGGPRKPGSNRSGPNKSGPYKGGPRK
jgi:23S rRNA pseudouridine2605 synthase